MISQLFDFIKSQPLGQVVVTLSPVAEHQFTEFPPTQPTHTSVAYPVFCDLTVPLTEQAMIDGGFSPILNHPITAIDQLKVTAAWLEVLVDQVRSLLLEQDDEYYFLSPETKISKIHLHRLTIFRQYSIIRQHWLLSPSGLFVGVRNCSFIMISCVTDRGPHFISPIP